MKNVIEVNMSLSIISVFMVCACTRLVAFVISFTHLFTICVNNYSTVKRRCLPFSIYSFNLNFPLGLLLTISSVIGQDLRANWETCPTQPTEFLLGAQFIGILSQGSAFLEASAIYCSSTQVE